MNASHGWRVGVPTIFVQLSTIVATSGPDLFFTLLHNDEDNKTEEKLMVRVKGFLNVSLKDRTVGFKTAYTLKIIITIIIIKLLI